MSECRGLHNPERHAPTSIRDMAWCNVCDSACYTTAACHCCLAAEVERLTAKIEQVKQAAAEVLAKRDRRIALAVAFCEEAAGDHPDRDIAADYSPLLARDVLVILRGES